MNSNIGKCQSPIGVLSNSEFIHAIESLRPLVLKFCERYLYNLHDAEEACQDILFKSYFSAQVGCSYKWK